MFSPHTKLMAVDGDPNGSVPSFLAGKGGAICHIVGESFFFKPHNTGIRRTTSVSSIFHAG